MDLNIIVSLAFFIIFGSYVSYVLDVIKNTIQKNEDAAFIRHKQILENLFANQRELRQSLKTIADDRIALFQNLIEIKKEKKDQPIEKKK